MSGSRCRACGLADVPLEAEKLGFPVGRCPACGSINVLRLPDGAEIAALYAAHRFSEKYRRTFRIKVWRSFKRLSLVRALAPGRRLLDVGCSVGATMYAGRLLGMRPVGIDMDAEALRAARSRLPGARIDCAPLEGWDGRGDLFDALHCTEVIEHALDPDGFAARLRALAAPRAVLFLTSPDAGHPKVPRDWTSWSELVPPGHLTLFTKDGMRSLLERAGFTDVRFWPHAKPGLRVLARAD